MKAKTDAVSLDDGDVSSAPISSRRIHSTHPHAYHSDASSLSGNIAGAANTANATSLGNSRAYYDGLASRSSRLQNMPSSSSITSVGSNSADSKTYNANNSIPESPAPQIPHAPSHPRHISPNSAPTPSTAGTASSRPTLPKDVHHTLSKSEAVHHPAPHGFLAKMSALDLQESVKLAIDGAGADGVDRNYKIDPPPIGRPVRIYADGVYDLVYSRIILYMKYADPDSFHFSFIMAML